jgi:hypothetical protein
VSTVQDNRQLEPPSRRPSFYVQSFPIQGSAERLVDLAPVGIELAEFGLTLRFHVLVTGDHGNEREEAHVK